MKPGPPSPMPVPAGAPVLLYGGVFDPPHLAHVELPVAARDLRMPGAWLVYVPAARSPFKDAARTSDAQRIEMVRRAISDVPRAAVWTDEIDRAAPGEASYWIDTVRRAREALGPGTALGFLIGADQASEFHRWRDFREIIRSAGPLVMLRPPVDSPAELEALLRSRGVWSEEEIACWVDRIIPLPLAAMSATDVRERLARGESPDGSLDHRVLDYIRAHGLYAGRPG